MVEHSVICKFCNIEQKVDNFFDNYQCPECGRDMGIVAVVSGRGGDYHHTSDSLAIHPDDISQHKQLFPDVEVTSEGQPQFSSPRQQEKYAEKCGFYKKPQKTQTQRLGRVRIA